MKGNQIVSSLDTILTWLTRLAFVNLLWIFFSILGIFVVGIFPATVAAFGVCRKWLLWQKDFPIWSTFKQLYKEDFITSNILGWILTFIGVLLYVNYRIMTNSGEVFIGIPIAFYLLNIFYVILNIWSFALLSHYSGSIKQHLKNSFIIGIANVHYSVAITVILFGIIYVSLEFPGFIPFFSISLGTLSWAWISLRVFKKIDSIKVI